VRPVVVPSACEVVKQIGQNWLPLCVSPHELGFAVLPAAWSGPFPHWKVVFALIWSMAVYAYHNIGGVGLRSLTLFGKFQNVCICAVMSSIGV
jgi:hypothetical protein